MHRDDTAEVKSKVIRPDAEPPEAQSSTVSEDAIEWPDPSPLEDWWWSTMRPRNTES